MLWKRRKHLDRVGRKIGLLFSKLPMSPNAWTCLGLVLAIINLYFLFNKDFLIATAVFGFAALLDMIDGSVARIKKKVTKLGGYLDSVTDRTVEFVIILGLFLVGYPSFILPMDLWIFLLLFGSFMSTYMRAVSFEKKIRRNVIGGVLEHADRMLVFFLIIIISNFSLQYATYLIALAAILSLVSALQRFLKATKR
ncbi:MAG: CDP-alcohol phosphatidyltransferase family protein [Candidatus Aenigmatarchaeota archaeon]